MHFSLLRKTRVFALNLGKCPGESVAGSQPLISHVCLGQSPTKFRTNLAPTCLPATPPYIGTLELIPIHQLRVNINFVNVYNATLDVHCMTTEHFK